MLLAVTGQAEPNPEAYPTPASKKGLQVQMVDDALALGIKHAGLNCSLGNLVELKPQPSSIPFQYEGRDYYFRADAVAALDQQVKPLSDHGVVVSLILLVIETGNPEIDAFLLHPRYDRAAKTNKISAFNTATPEGKQWLEAILNFLAGRYSAPEAKHGRVWNYIVGNEVNSHWWWNNMGRATAEEVASEYERAVRLVHQTVRRHSAHARVFLSLEHHWSIRYAAGAADQACPGRDLLLAFAHFAQVRGDFDWHLAYHPYPENLGEPCFWRDQSPTDADDTPRITFKNLEVLPRFLTREDLRFAGQLRRIILSEQGFHCPDRPNGELEQAAAYCAAWWKVARLDGIDSFILHRHVDHAHEGLNLGLWTRKSDSVFTPERHRRMYEPFRLADTREWESAFQFALPVIGIERWEQLLPTAKQSGN